MTCSALEWVNSHGGGSIVEPDGTISINNDNAAAAFTRAKNWVSGPNPISPIATLSYQEGEVLAAWQAGKLKILSMKFIFLFLIFSFYSYLRKCCFYSFLALFGFHF